MNLHHSDDYPDHVDLTSGDEDGQDPVNEPDAHGMYTTRTTFAGRGRQLCGDRVVQKQLQEHRLEVEARALVPI